MEEKLVKVDRCGHDQTQECREWKVDGERSRGPQNCRPQGASLIFLLSAPTRSPHCGCAEMEPVGSGRTRNCVFERILQRCLSNCSASTLKSTLWYSGGGHRRGRPIIEFPNRKDLKVGDRLDHRNSILQWKPMTCCRWYSSVSPLRKRCGIFISQCR